MFLSFFIVLGGAQLQRAEAAVNDYVVVSKTVNPTSMTTLDEAEVTLNVMGTPPTNVTLPNDVVLIIDKSGSMAPGYNNGEDKMQNAKNAAKGFIDLMDMTKHNVGIVDFSSSTMIGSFPLTTDKDAAKSYIDGISANGATATGDAIQAAAAMLANHRPEAQPVIVIMTDGDATQPTNDPYGYAKQQAQLAKDAGIVFYTIALLKSTDNPDTSGPNELLKEMATTAVHHHFVLGSTGLSDIYAAIVKEIGLASAYDVKISDVVDPNFEIVPGSADNNIPKPIINGNTLTWEFNELKSSTLSFQYKIRPINKTKVGTFPISTASSVITYKDYAGSNRTKLIPSVDLTLKLPAPEITTLEAPAGHPSGGQTVTITGKNFVNGATVLFGAVAATNVIVGSDTKITVTAPAGKQGIVDVVVKNPDNQKAVAQYQYKADPIVSSLEPNNGDLIGGNIVTIKGNYLMPGASVFFGTQQAPISLYSNLTYLKVKVPAASAPGPVDVTFTNPDGTSVVVPGGYTYNEPPKTDPEVLKISPNAGLVTGGDIAYVDGINFKSDMKVSIGGKQASTIFVSATRFKVTIPSASSAGTADVTVTDVNGANFSLTGGYTYNEIQYPTPAITSVTPNTGLIDGGEIVYVNGSNFVNGISKVSIGGKDAATTYVTSIKLKVVVPAGDNIGQVDVKVANAGNESVLTQGYEYTLPIIQPITISTITPNFGKVTGGDVIYIDGLNFKSGSTVSFGSNQVNSTFVSSTRIKVTTPAAAAAGKVDVTVTNLDGGTGTLVQGYNYVAVTPTITSLSADHANKIGGDILYINGTNFDNSATVTVNGNSAAVTFVSDTRLKFTVPASSITGTVPLVVSLSNGQSASFNFTYDNGPILPAPSITSMTSTSGTPGTIFYIDGKNFTSKSTVYFGSTKAVVTYVSASRLKVTAPAGTGAVSVKVINIDAQESNTVQYTYL